MFNILIKDGNIAIIFSLNQSLHCSSVEYVNEKQLIIISLKINKNYGKNCVFHDFRQFFTRGRATKSCRCALDIALKHKNLVSNCSVTSQLAVHKISLWSDGPIFFYSRPKDEKWALVKKNVLFRTPENRFFYTNT